MQERRVRFTFTWLSHYAKKYMKMTADQTLTVILKIFFCTVGWLIKLANYWATEN